MKSWFKRMLLVGVGLLAGVQAFAQTNNYNILDRATAAITGGTIDNTAITNGSVTGAAISGGSLSGATVSAVPSPLGIRSSGAGFDLQIGSSEAITANRLLSFVLGNAARTLTVAGSTTVPIASQPVTIAGPTAARTYTFPDAAASIARTDAAQTFTGTQTMGAFVATGGSAIGAAPVTGTNLRMDANITGAVSSRGYDMASSVQSDVTTQAVGYRSAIGTAAASFTLPDMIHYSAAQGTIGAGSTVTNQYGFFTSSNLTGATNNYAYYSNMAAATGRWGFFESGGANNAFAGNLRVGGTTTPNNALDVTGNVFSTGVVTANALNAGSTMLSGLGVGGIGIYKKTASASAPGAAGGKLELVCGTTAGTAKLIIYAGTSGTASTILDNIGSGVTGC